MGEMVERLRLRWKEITNDDELPRKRLEDGLQKRTSLLRWCQVGSIPASSPK